MTGIQEIERKHGTEIAAMILVCRVFVGSAHDDDLKKYIGGSNIDWSLFHKLIIYHQVRPIVYKVLFPMEIPGDLKDKLQAECKYIAFRNIEISKELLRLYDLLAKENVFVVPYKGSTLCVEYYKDIGLREFCDIDFLIDADPKVPAKISSVVKALGYIDKSEVPDDFQETNFRHTREYYFDFYETDIRKFHVEFHWSVAHQDLDFTTPLPNRELFRHLQDRTIFGKNVKVLDTTHHLIAVIAHHGLNQRWGILKYLVDLHQMLKNGGTPDWNGIFGVSGKYGFTNVLNIGLYTAENLLGIAPGVSYSTPQGGHKYIDATLSSYSNRYKTGIANSMLQNLRLKDNFGDKMKMAFKYARFAISPSVLDYRFFKLPKALFFLYPIVKPFRLIAGRGEKRPDK